MKLKVIQYDGTEAIYNVESFEFRTNQVSNWVRIKFSNDEVIVIKNVCVIKTVD